MSDPTPFVVGQKVSLAKWDATQRPANRMGESTVVKVRNSKTCQSGTMVMVQSGGGRRLDLDSGWLEAMP